MDSADTPLAVHSLNSGHHHQRRYCGTGEIQQQARPISSGHSCLAPAHRPVLVRAAVCQQVAGPRMKQTDPPEAQQLRFQCHCIKILDSLMSASRFPDVQNKIPCQSSGSSPEIAGKLLNGPHFWQKKHRERLMGGEPSL
jgi:hypothetical protein